VKKRTQKFGLNPIKLNKMQKQKKMVSILLSTKYRKNTKKNIFYVLNLTIGCKETHTNMVSILLSTKYRNIGKNVFSCIGVNNLVKTNSKMVSVP
jgi:hypothetical protein